MQITTHQQRDDARSRFGFTVTVDLAPDETPTYASLLEALADAGVEATAQLVDVVLDRERRRKLAAVSLAEALINRPSAPATPEQFARPRGAV